MRIIDLTGHKFGLLTVMYPTGEIMSKSRVWVCQCDCGQTNKVTIRGLRTGSVRSCGCLRKSDLIGKKYGKLTVLSRIEKDTWLCCCDCGNEIRVQHDDLTLQKIKSCGCKRDLAGRRYGKLIVIRSAGNDDWTCRCDCGREITVFRADLTKHKVSSCGCKFDLTGRRYGKLTAIEKAGEDNWLCRCDCGNTITVPRKALTYKKVKSCGCKKDITGKRYGYLTVVSKEGNDTWLCRCDCGREVNVSYADLTHKRVKSCGVMSHILPGETDYTGMTINGFIGVCKVRNSFWLWRCNNCGNVSERKISDVKNGKTCACQIAADEVDYAGKKYASLTGERKVGKNRWLWKCDCGTLAVYKVDEVITGKKKSCLGHREHHK